MKTSTLIAGFLIAIAAVTLVALVVPRHTNESATRAPPPIVKNDPRPVAQLRFCEIIDLADAAYEPKSKAWYDEQNPIARDRLTPVLAKMRDDRDKAVLEHLGAKQPSLTGWTLRLSDFHTGMTPNEIMIDFSVRCGVFVTLKTTFKMTAGQADLLAAVQRGAYLKASGSFFGHDIEANPPARALNWDGFEHSAMRSPTYHFTLTELAKGEP